MDRGPRVPLRAVDGSAVRGRRGGPRAGPARRPAAGTDGRPAARRAALRRPENGLARRVVPARRGVRAPAGRPAPARRRRERLLGGGARGPAPSDRGRGGRVLPLPHLERPPGRPGRDVPRRVAAHKSHAGRRRGRILGRQSRRRLLGQGARGSGLGRRRDRVSGRRAGRPGAPGHTPDRFGARLRRARAAPRRPPDEGAPRLPPQELRP